MISPLLITLRTARHTARTSAAIESRDIGMIDLSQEKATSDGTSDEQSGETHGIVFTTVTATDSRPSDV